MERPTSLVRAWAAGAATIGASCKIPSSLVAEAVAATGFDFVYVDQQHGVIDNSTLLALLQAVEAGGAVPVTRVAANSADAINRALDFGAMGIIVPLVESAAEAASAVAACRYPPRGVRSYGAVRARPAPGSGSGELDRPACIVLVESARGLAGVDAIAATDGVDAVMIGANDLALSLGLELEGDWLASAPMSGAVEEIRAAADRHGIVAGIGCSSGEETLGWLRRGFRLVNLGNDFAHMKAALARHLADVRAGRGDLARGDPARGEPAGEGPGAA